MFSELLDRATVNLLETLKHDLATILNKKQVIENERKEDFK